MDWVKSVFLLLILLISSVCLSQESGVDEFHQFCPPDGQKAVSAEHFEGCQFGWIHLVCADFAVHKISYWFITPDNEVITTEDAILPSCHKPPQYDDLLAEMELLPDNSRVPFFVSFKYDSSKTTRAPNVDSYMSTSGTGERSVYWVNEVEVTKEEHEVVKEQTDKAVKRHQEQEIRALIKENFYDFVESNNLQDRIDTTTVNTDSDSDIYWQGPNTLVVDLNHKEIKRITSTSTHLVTLSIKNIKVETYSD